MIMDMTCTLLLRCITECSPSEAQRIVFMGWMGQVRHAMMDHSIKMISTFIS